MKLFSLFLPCLFLLMGTEVAFANTPAPPAYRVDYVEETILLRKDTTIVIVNLDLEWPKRLCGSAMPVLQSYLCKEVFDNMANSMEEGKKLFLESLGQRIEAMPDDPQLSKCFLHVMLKELAWERDNWISFRLVIVGRDATKQEGVLLKSLLFTYDIVEEKVLTTNDLLKSIGRIDGIDHDYMLDIFDKFYPSIDQMADGDKLPDQTCLLTSDVGVAFNLVGTDVGDKIEHLLVAPTHVMLDLLTRRARKMIETPASVRWQKIRKVKNMDFKADEAADDDMSFAMPDTMPQFRGGAEQLARFLSKEVQYPTYESLLHIEGRSLVSFIVDKTGQVHSPSIVLLSSPGFDREAVRAVLAMPKWTPAKRGGEPVDMRVTIPVKFKLKQE